MEVGQEEVKNLPATLTPSAKQKLKHLLKEAVTAGDAMTFFRTRIQLSCFFVQLLREVAKERQRMAFEKLQRCRGIRDRLIPHRRGETQAQRATIHIYAGKLICGAIPNVTGSSPFRDFLLPAIHDNR
jgi:hypothetical protein